MGSDIRWFLMGVKGILMFKQGTHNMVILREACLQKLKANTYTLKMHTKTKYHKQNSKEKQA